MNFDPANWLQQLYSVPADTPGGVGAVDAYGKNVAAAAGQGALGMGQAGLGLTQSYINEYQPYDRKLMSYVDSIGTDAYRAQQRGQAMTGVQQQADAARMTQNRDMARMGVNPNSARFAGVNGALAQQTALNKVMAAMGADRNSRDEWAKGLGAINAMGLKVGELGNKNMAVAGDLAKVGMFGADMGATAMDRQTQAGAAATGAGAAAMNASTNATKLGMDYQLGLGKLALDRYSTDRQWDYNNRALDNKIDAGGLDNVFASTVIGAGTNAAVDLGKDYIKGKITGSNYDPSQYTYTQSDGSFSVTPPGSFDPVVYANNDSSVYGW